MPDVREFESVMADAEQAARAGEAGRAEQLLREALRLHLAALGPSHPDLASTLNNLAVVCESTGKLDDAEAFYRQAHAVAAASRPPDDPLVITSRDNLRDFCAARSRAVEDWPDLGEVRPVEPAAAAPPEPPATPAAPEARTRVAAPQAPVVPGPRRREPWPLAARLALGVGVAAVLMFLLQTRRDEAPPAATQETAVAPGAAAAPPTPAASVATAAPPVAPARAAEPPPTTASAGADIRVLVSDVCRTLSTSGAWRCDPAGASPEAGRLSYFTRIAAPRDLRVQHRWYRGDTLRQSVTLSIAANPSAGYRTFSRQTVSPGPWRVELRAADGRVLHEAAFEVR